MPRAHLLLSTSVLLSCAAGSADTGAAAPPEAAVLPTGAASGWLEAVRLRIAASARAIVPQGGAFAAALPAHSAVARFTDEGLVLGEQGAEEPLAFRFSAWGTAGAEREVEPVAPALGDCLTDALPDGDCARQLEYAHPGVTAWWVGLDRGVEFGWTVAAPPAEGGAELAFWTEVEGADWLEATGEGAEVVDAAGVSWTISGALAWGADGAPLPAWVEVEGDALVVRVAAAGAAYPVTVDPVLSAASTTLTGVALNDGLGWSVSGAGDVNGDGYDDVIVGAPYYTNGTLNFCGAAYVHHGSPSGVASTASATLTGGGTYDYFGWSVSGAGDVNGDGYDDILVGAYHYDNFTGRAYVHHGSSSGVLARASVILTGGAANDQFGFSVAGAGDVNDDGYDDVVIGAPYHSNGALTESGAAYIHHGSTSSVSTSASTTLTGSATYNFLGNSVSGAGDTNGDGFDDVVIGAPGYSSGSLLYSGRAYIHQGSASGVSSSASSTVTGGAASDYLGYSVAGAGDVNGDGYDDVILGANYYTSGALPSAGAAYIHHGSPSGVTTSASSTLTGSAAYRELGFSVASAGDVNNDGFDDVIVGSNNYTGAGEAYIHQGSAGGVSLIATVTLSGVTLGDGFGWSAAGAGDVNGDGHDDVIVGAPRYDNGALSDAGAAHIHHGYADEDGDGVYVGGDSGTPQDCDDADASVGAGAPRYLDADGDGFGSGTIVPGCTGGTGTATSATDCDDTRADVNPSGTEICDAANTDEDCDGLADDADPTVDASGFSTYYADTDADGFGDAAAPTSSCDLPPAHVTDRTDCDDATATVNPAATDIPDDTVDQDCDGADATSGGPPGNGGTTGGSGCSAAPGATMPWLGALLALPALVLRRRRA
jgi:hypothetical protein